MTRAERLAELGIDLPEVASPLGSYKPASVTGSLVFVSGQLPLSGGKLVSEGKVGADVSPEDAALAARQSAINVLAVMKKELGTLDNVKKIVKVTGYVASAPGFTGQAGVLNGASNLFFDVFGEAGRHARAAVGVSELPLNAPVEVEIVAEIL